MCLLHLLKSSLFRLKSDCLELVCVWLGLTEALRHVIGRLLSLCLGLSSLFLDLSSVLLHIFNLVNVLLDFYHQALYALHLVGVEDRRFDKLADRLISRGTGLAVACSQAESLQLLLEHRQDALEGLVCGLIILQFHFASTLLEDGRVKRLLVFIGELCAESLDLNEVFEG